MTERTPFQDDGLFSLDTTCKDYDLLHHLHKHDDHTDREREHYEAGWEAAMSYYRECFKRPKKDPTFRSVDDKNRISLKDLLDQGTEYSVRLGPGGVLTLVPIRKKP